MLDFFRKNLFVFNALLLAYCLILRLGGFIKPVAQPDESSLLGSFAENLVGGAGSWTATLVAFLIVTLNAIQINRLVSLNRLTATSSMFAGVFYILISSFTLDLHSLDHALLGNVFMIMMLLEIFKQTRNEELLIRTFNVGLLAGLASLCYTPYIVLLPLGIVGMINVRTFKRLDYFRAILGFICPFIFAFTILILSDQLSLFWTGHFSDSFAVLDVFGDLAWQDYVVLSLVVLAMILSLLTMTDMTMKTNIHARRKISTLYIVLAVLTLLIPFVANTGVHSIHMVSVPLSIFVGAMFLRIDKQTAEVLHFILLAAVIGFQYIF